MNPLMGGMPSLSASDSSTTASGDVNGRNQNGGAIHFAPTWQSSLPLIAVAVIAVGALIYLVKK